MTKKKHRPESKKAMLAELNRQLNQYTNLSADLLDLKMTVRGGLGFYNLDDSLSKQAVIGSIDILRTLLLQFQVVIEGALDDVKNDGQGE